MGALWNIPRFRRLWLGEAFCQFGQWLSYVALSSLAAKETAAAGALPIALVLILHALPGPLITPFAGPLSDRLSPRRLLLGATLGRGLLALLMAGCVRESRQWPLLALLAIRVALGALAEPAIHKAAAMAVPPALAQQASRFRSLSWSVLFAAGSACGGLLTAWAGPSLTLAMDAGVFAMAALAFSSLDQSRPALRTSGQKGIALAQSGGGWAEVWQALMRRRGLRFLLAGKWAVALASGGLWVALSGQVGARWGPAPNAIALVLGVVHGCRALGAAAASASCIISPTEGQRWGTASHRPGEQWQSHPSRAPRQLQRGTGLCPMAPR